jgi:hypothetical protein
MTIKPRNIQILDGAFRAAQGCVDVSITRHRHVVQISVQDGPNGQSYELSLEELAKAILEGGILDQYATD